MYLSGGLNPAHEGGGEVRIDFNVELRPKLSSDGVNLTM